jgi:hypothetical protein
MSTNRVRLDENDKTPSEPTRLLSAAALNLHSLAASVAAIARALDRAAADPVSRAALGRQLVDLGRELVANGKSISEETHL